jgi:hypothetical protein
MFTPPFPKGEEMEKGIWYVLKVYRPAHLLLLDLQNRPSRGARMLFLDMIRSAFPNEVGDFVISHESALRLSLYKSYLVQELFSSGDIEFVVDGHVINSLTGNIKNPDE